MPLEVDFESSAHSFSTNGLVELLDEACALAIGRGIIENLTHVCSGHLVTYWVAGTKSLTANTPILILEESNPGRFIEVR